MNYKRIILSLSATFISWSVLADEIKLQLAQKSDIVGAWKVVAFIPGSFGDKNPTSDLLSPSQLYGFYEDGLVRSLTSDEKKTFAQNLNELSQHFSNRERKIHWQTPETGLMAITINPEKTIGTLWQTSIAVEDGTYNGIPLLKGDMIQAMTPDTKSSNNNARFIRILRKNK